jgi:hypothetical protein
MKVFVVVIDQVPRLFWILDKLLQSISCEKFAIGFLDPPIQLSIKLTRLGLREEMDLAGKYL